ncbi:MAG: ATP-binding cassette domain-containing protein [Acidobacteriota bacterium]
MIRVENLRKVYGTHVAVDDVSFEARPGEIFGLLGPNGAGKTTTISVLAGLLKASGGTVLVDGRPMSPRATAVKMIMGVVPQEVALYQELTARENLSFWGGLYGLGRAALRRRVGIILERTGLAERADDRVKTYSGGMKRRLNLGVGLVHQPKVLLLDEPTVGVDPQARINILDVIREISRQGATVLYTTHYMGEAEELCHRLAVLDHGRILAEGSVAELKKMVGEGEVITVKGQFSAEEMRRSLDGFDGVRAVSLADHQAMLSVQGEGGTARLLQGLLGRSLAIEQVAVREPSLEQVFLKLTGRELRD